MSAKTTTQFVCQQCGAKFPRWSGQCGSCGEWNTLVEEVVARVQPSQKARSNAAPTSHQSLNQIWQAENSTLRISTGLPEFDRVLGGNNPGLVPGMVVLLGGYPGIGKSTLVTQAILQMISGGQDRKEGQAGRKNKTSGLDENSMANNSSQRIGNIVYVSGEENPDQVALRIKRLLAAGTLATSSLSPQVMDQLKFVASTDVDSVIASLDMLQPSLVVVDSIQTLVTTDLTGSAGSVGQVRESCNRLTQWAKSQSVPLLLIGHVTKEGQIAGPMVLEHMVDSVIELTGERTGDLRLLRAMKNRFGPTDEVGVFHLTEAGLLGVDNPSQFFLEQRLIEPGSVVAGVMEGTRPLLIEVQALAVPSSLPTPRRVGRGVEMSRIQVLSAVLQKFCRLPTGESDVFVSIAGGYSTKEPSLDLAVAVAIASSLLNLSVSPKSVFIGEVGLLGEIRSVQFLEKRVKEAKRLGFDQVITHKTHKTLREVVASLRKSNNS